MQRAGSREPLSPWVMELRRIYGMDHAMYGEVVTFESGLKGMVQDIRQDSIGCILFGKDTEIGEGTRAVQNRKKSGRPRGRCLYRPCN